MSLGISEILLKASKLSTKEEQINFLRQHGTSSLMTLVRYALDPNVTWLIPSNFPPFDMSVVSGQETMFLAETRRLYLFVHDTQVTGSPVSLTPAKRQTLLKQLLEMLAPEDISTLALAVEKKLPYDLSYDLMWEAFPGLLPAATFPAKVQRADRFVTYSQTNYLTNQDDGHSVKTKSAPKKKVKKKAKTKAKKPPTETETKS